MDKMEQAAFYVGALLYLDLESDEVDDILAAADLDVHTNTVAECREAIKLAYPKRYELGKRFGGERMLR